MDFNNIFSKESQFPEQLFRTARSNSPDDESAKDSVQDLCLKVVENPTFLDGVENEPAFLKKTLRNMCIDKSDYFKQ